MSPATTRRWVELTCRVRCRACGAVVAVNHVPGDEPVLCPSCGAAQSIAPTAWQEALEVARAVTGSTWTEHRGALELAARPGRPRCPHCGEGLTTSLAAGGVVSHCKRCNRSATYRLPPGRERAGVLGAIAAAHCVDLPLADADETATATAVRCPSCAAPLAPAATSPYVECAYCHVVSRLPTAGAREPGRVEPWWLWLEGVPAPAKAPAPKPPSARPTANQASRTTHRRARKASPLVATVAPLVALLLVGAVGYREDVRRWLAVQSAISTAKRSAPAIPAPADVPLSAFTSLQGCTCELGNRSLALTMYVGAGTGDDATQPPYPLGFGLRRGRQHSRLPLAADRAPPLLAARSSIGLGIACAGEHVLVAGERAVSAWSPNGALVWTRVLPSAYRYPSQAGAGGVHVNCGPLAVRKRTVQVPLVDGTTVAVRLRDGQLREPAPAR